MKKLSLGARRQYTQAASAFELQEVLLQEEVFLRSSSMAWQQTAQGQRLLLMTGNKQNDLGPRSDKTLALLQAFKDTGRTHALRLKKAQQELAAQELRNFKRKLGRVDPLFVRFLNELSQEHHAESFRVVCPQAIHAFAYAAGVSLSDEPQEVFGLPRHISFSSKLDRHDTEEIVHRALLKTDPHFRMLGSRKVQALTRDGHAVDVIQDEGVNPDSRHFRLGEGDNDFWAAFVKELDASAYARPFSAVVVATTGEMARMHTAHPTTFTLLKRWMSRQLLRHPLRRPQDALQADVTEALLPLLPEQELSA